MKKGLSVLLAVMMMCSFTVSSWAAETSNEAPPPDMQECCEELCMLVEEKFLLITAV